MEWIGWVATAAFATSYFFRDPVVLRRWQGGAALLWMAYGFVIHSAPIVVANLLVAGLAIGSALVRRVKPLEATPAPSAATTSGRPPAES